MRRIYGIFIKKGNQSRLFAAAFLVLLFAEWGTHTAAPAGSQVSDAPAVSAANERHGDLCDLLILCSDNGRRDQQSQTFGREVTQHNALLEMFAVLRSPIQASAPSQIAFSSSDGLFRPIDPPFHPPELS